MDRQRGVADFQHWGLTLTRRVVVFHSHPKSPQSHARRSCTHGRYPRRSAVARRRTGIGEARADGRSEARDPAAQRRQRAGQAPPPRSRRGRPQARRQGRPRAPVAARRSEEHTSELQSRENLVCRLLLEKKKNNTYRPHAHKKKKKKNKV